MSLFYRTAKKKRTRTYLLIGDGFDELEVIMLLNQFRSAGLLIKSVSLFDKLVFSHQGVGIKTDYSLADEPFPALSDCLLILPTGGQNEGTLRHDARVKSLLKRFHEDGGQVAITNRASRLTQDVTALMPHHMPFVPQQGEGLTDFVAKLRDAIAFA